MEPLRQDNQDWGPVRRVLFRFLFCYLVLYNFFFPLHLVPVYGEVLKQSYLEIWQVAAPWVGEHVLGVKVLYRPGGSGDTTFNYVQIFCFLAVSVAATLIWSLLDRRRRNYARLYEWLRVYVRFVLAAAMILYGAYKVIPSQFGTPLPSELLQPIGEGSPMGLLWSFMGASYPYIIFTGAAEVLGGVLLATRRTTLPGALVCIGVMSNVVLLNLSYDVPVKLFSSHLLLMAVFLAVPDLRRLASLFVWNRRVPPAEQRPLFASRKANRAALVFRTVFILFIVAAAFHRSYTDKMEYEFPLYQQRLYGAWEVENFAVDGTVRPLLITDKTLWRRLVFEWPGTIGIQYAPETLVRGYELRPDPGPYAFTLCCEPEWKAAAISWKRVAPDVLTVEASVNGQQIRGRFRRMGDSRFLLISRGFHWINEQPFNR